MDECEHGSDPTTCPPCRRAAGKDQVEAVRVEFEFMVKFDGLQCSECNLPVPMGCMAKKWTDGRFTHGGVRGCDR